MPVTLGTIASHRTASGAFAPDDLSGLVGWWDADDAATITASAGAVSQWDDKSGDGRHVSLSFGTVTTGSRTINSKNVLEFSAAMLVSGSGPTYSQPLTTSVVVEADTASGNGYILGHNAGQNVSVLMLGGVWTLYDGAVLSGTAVDTNAHVFSALHSGASSQTWIDGTVDASGNGGTAGIAGAIQIGSEGSNPWPGPIAEILMYNSALSTTDRQQVEAYLQAKWGTPPSSVTGTGLRGWWDAADAGTFTYVSGTQVSQWGDKSGNGHHLVQVSGGDGTGPERNGTQNGLTTVVWDGACWAIGDDSIPTDTQPNTVFIVAKVVSTSWAGVLDGGSGTMIRRQGSDGNIAFDAGTAASYTMNNTGHHILAAVFNGASSSQRIDRTQVGTTNTGTGVFAKFHLGHDWGDNKLNGEIAEVLIYDAALSGGDITTVETYLQAKWGTP